MSATSIKVTVRDDNYTSAEAKSPTCWPSQYVLLAGDKFDKTFYGHNYEP